ncbi:MAG: hypothetical protein A2Y40_04445 [Candidatus Margulisbacteria bacterium GWF2_35_9]|nr:MAG: hypothetical protein A2Y40_04445 [Candidatus Margulisbacteria bacterium GWF2_35_9]
MKQKILSIPLKSKEYWQMQYATNVLPERLDSVEDIWIAGTVINDVSNGGTSFSVGNWIALYRKKGPYIRMELTVSLLEKLEKYNKIERSDLRESDRLPSVMKAMSSDDWDIKNLPPIVMNLQKFLKIGEKLLATLDGRHRLYAAKITKKPIYMYISETDARKLKINME